MTVSHGVAVTPQVKTWRRHSTFMYNTFMYSIISSPSPVSPSRMEVRMYTNTSGSRLQMNSM